MSIKRAYITAVFVLCAFLLSFAPVWAAEEANVITLCQAKELARTKARSMQNLDATKDKLKIDAKIAFDNYFGTDTQNNIDGYKTRIMQLQSQIDGLDPVLNAAEIAALRAKIVEVEKTVSRLRAVLPSTEDASNALRLQWRAKDHAYEDMDKIRSDAEKELEARVESMYFGLLNTQNTVLIQEKNLEYLGAQLQIERIKYALGLSTVIDEKNAVVQYDNLYKMLADLKNTKQIVTRQMNDLMGREVHSKLNVVPEQITPVLTMVNYEDVFNKAIENSLSIAQKKRECEDYAADARKETASDERGSLLLGEEIAKIALEELKESTAIRVKALVNGLEASYKGWENKALDKNKAELTYLNDKAKYELGVISKLQYMGSELTYLQAVNDELTAAQNWYMAKHKLELANEGILTQS